MRAMEEKEEMRAKCVLVGDTGVGKTCLLRRFTQNDCPQSHIVTIGKKTIFSLKIVILCF